MTEVRQREIAASESGLRLDRWFRIHYPDLAHGALEKLLRTGQVRVNGGRAKANRRVAAGETVRIPPIKSVKADRPPPRFNPGDAAFIRSLALYEDEAILALNKPFGLAVQGGSKTPRHIDGMLAALEKDGERPRLVHRLDRDTGGLLLLAKTRAAASALARSFHTRDVDKTYWALVAGVPRPREGTIDLAIAKRNVSVGAALQERVAPGGGDEARNAVTDFMTVEEAGRVSFLALRPRTGRTHQLRVHCAAMDAPIIGDRKYGGAAARIAGVADGLMLFCRQMTFPHPSTSKPMTLAAPLTGRMAETWRFFGFDQQAEVQWPDRV